MIDAMSGVFETAVIGVPHPDFGEAVVAAVVRQGNEQGAAATEAGIISALKGALANFKVPKRVHFVDIPPAQQHGQGSKEHPAGAIQLMLTVVQEGPSPPFFIESSDLLP